MQKFLIDVEQDACVKYVEVILADEFGVSPPSDLKTVGMSNQSSLTS